MVNHRLGAIHQKQVRDIEIEGKDEEESEYVGGREYRNRSEWALKSLMKLDGMSSSLNDCCSYLSAMRAICSF